MYYAIEAKMNWVRMIDAETYLMRSYTNAEIYKLLLSGEQIANLKTEYSYYHQRWNEYNGVMIAREFDGYNSGMDFARKSALEDENLCPISFEELKNVSFYCNCDDFLVIDTGGIINTWYKGIRRSIRADLLACLYRDDTNVFFMPRSLYDKNISISFLKELVVEQCSLSDFRRHVLLA